jgi:hypothetical protein
MPSDNDRNLAKVLNINIHKDWNLSVRTSNCLKTSNIIYLGELIQYQEKDLLSFINFGQKSLDEINEKLSEYSLKLGNRNVQWEIDHYKIENKNINQNTVPEKYNPDYLRKFYINILKEWPLSVRTRNCFLNKGIEFVGDLISYSKKELLNMQNFGRKSFNEIKPFLEKNSLSLGTPLIGWTIYKMERKSKASEEELKRNPYNRVAKSILDDFRKFVEKYTSISTITIPDNMPVQELEKLIISDIEEILLLLNNRCGSIFRARNGYLENCKSLDQIGKKHNITRERVRQIEVKINRSLIGLGFINKVSLLKYFSKLKNLSFHKIFPQLDKNFTDTARGVGDISGDKLAEFIENYCGVENRFFETPERTLFSFEKSRLENIFLEVGSPIKLPDFIEEIKSNYGYNEEVSKIAIDFMGKHQLVKIVDENIYPTNLRKNQEVAHILLSYPEGLHWREVCKIGNKSFTKNKWNLKRNVSDHSFTMIWNKDIYLSESGIFKNLKFLSSTKNKIGIIDAFIKEIKTLGKTQCAMEDVFKQVKKNKEFNDLNFYEARAVIKIFGEEKGIYHKGLSGANTIGLIKNIKLITQKHKILDIINSHDGEISRNEIDEKFVKTNKKAPTYYLNDLVDEMLIFKISPGIYLKYEAAIKKCDKELVEKSLKGIITNYEFLTIGFIREKLNEELGYELSNFYYDSLIRILAKKNSWYCGVNYLSKKVQKTKSAEQMIKSVYNFNLSTNENYDNISTKIGITMLELMVLRREVRRGFKIS